MILVDALLRVVHPRAASQQSTGCFLLTVWRLQFSIRCPPALCLEEAVHGECRGITRGKPGRAEREFSEAKLEFKPPWEGMSPVS